MQKTYHKKEVPELAQEKCGVIYALELIGGKWRLPVLWKLSKQETIRYNELRRQLPGVTNTMLTRVLVDLEANGLVVRQAYEQVPPHVEYRLTERSFSHSCPGNYWRLGQKQNGAGTRRTPGAARIQRERTKQEQQ